MRATRFLIVLLLLSLPASASSEDADDWKLIGGLLALMQQVVHIAAHSPDPGAAQKSVDTILSGEDARANRLASEVMDEVLRDVPAEQRGVFVALGRDLLALARRERARAGSETLLERPALLDPLQARKDLHAMGLRYWDEQQFLDAARRGDRVAVDLFLAARGLESRSRQPAR